jgi:Domain of unknown function (DUF4129)
MRHLATLPPGTRPPAQPRVERLAGLLVVASACTLETVPLVCWLLMLAAYDSADPNNAAMPFWWMWLLVFGIHWLAVLFTHDTDDDPRRRRMSTLLLTIAVATLGTLSLLVTYWLSPAARSFLADGGDTSGPVALALLVAWLWWRGLLLGRGRLTRERMYVRFIAALGVTIAALAGAAAIHGEVRALTVTYLALLLALLLFAGTMGLTLAQARDASYEMRSTYRGNQPLEMPPVFTRAWLTASMGLSLGLSLLALLLATLISRESVHVLAIAAGNIVNGLIDVVQAILTPIFVLAYLILDKPIEWLADYFHRLGPPKPLTVPPPLPSCKPTVVGTPVGGSATPGAACAPPTHDVGSTNLLPAEWLTALRWGAVILIVVVALVLLARVLSRFNQARQVRAFTEERTMLDGREILGGQLRRFLGGFRRAPVEVAPATDDLTAGTVRRMYRDTLAVAVGTRRARQAAETPREYQRRIASDDPLYPGMAAPPNVAGALAELTHAYELARYGQPDPNDSPPATPETTDAAEAVQHWLAEQQSQ